MTTNEIRALKDIADELRRLRTTIEKIAELCRVQTEAQKQSYDRAGIEQYMFITTHDAKTCYICAPLDGQIFNLKDMQVGENAPPMHPNCRCSTVAYMDRDVVFKAIEVYNEAKKEEPNITAVLKGIEDKTDAKLRGLENKLKNPNRIYQKLIEEPDKKVRDALRYTFELDDGKYGSEYKRIIALLDKEGYTLNEVKNYWDNTKNPYNGINTNVFTNGKYEFEIQYHTAETLRINERLHKLYEKYRTLNKRSAEAIKLQKAMTDLSKDILKPKGIDEV